MGDYGIVNFGRRLSGGGLYTKLYTLPWASTRLSKQRLWRTSSGTSSRITKSQKDVSFGMGFGVRGPGLETIAKLRFLIEAIGSGRSDAGTKFVRAFSSPFASS